jgi:hypothetical protein
MYPNMQPLQQITQSDLIDVAPAPGSTLLVRAIRLPNDASYMAMPC